MNNLSWMIYFAELSGSVSGFLTFLSFASGVGVLATFIGWCVTMGEPHIWSWELGSTKAELHTADHRRMHTEFLKFIPRFAGALVAFGLTATVLPSKETVYAIAASEMGEQLLDTPTTGKAVKALDAWLDRQIAGDAEPAPDAK